MEGRAIGGGSTLRRVDTDGGWETRWLEGSSGAVGRSRRHNQEWGIAVSREETWTADLHIQSEMQEARAS